MTQEIKHTELPWQIASDYEPTLIIGNMDDAIDAKHYTEICRTEEPYGEADDKANAEFIVRACNSHYELLKVLKDNTSQSLNDMADWDAGTFRNFAIDFWHEAKAAIARAEGK